MKHLPDERHVRTMLLQRLQLLRRRPWVCDQSEITSIQAEILLQNAGRYVNGEVPDMASSVEVLDGSSVLECKLHAGPTHASTEDEEQRGEGEC